MRELQETQNKLHELLEEKGFRDTDAVLDLILTLLVQHSQLLLEHGLALERLRHQGEPGSANSDPVCSEKNPTAGVTCELVALDTLKVERVARSRARAAIKVASESLAKTRAMTKKTKSRPERAPLKEDATPSASLQESDPKADLLALRKTHEEEKAANEGGLLRTERVPLKEDAAPSASLQGSDLKGDLLALRRAHEDEKAPDEGDPSSLLEPSKRCLRIAAKVFFSLRGADLESNTPLHVASWHGHPDTVHCLLTEAMANVKAKNKYGVAPLSYAISCGHLEVAKLLIAANADVKETHKIGLNHLHLASAHGHLETVKYLLTGPFSSMEANKITNNHGMVLLLATWEGHLDIVNYLLTKARADFKHTDNNCHYLLHVASACGRLHSVRHSDIGMISLTINDGSLTLYDVHSCGRVDLTIYLATQGNRNVQINGNHDTNLLHIASLRGHLNVAQYFITRGIYEVESTSDDGSTPIFCATWAGHLDMTKYLLTQASADVSRKGNHGDTLLHVASTQGHLDIVSYLLNDGFLNLKSTSNDSGHTPLFCATTLGNFEVLKCLLIEAGEEVKYTDKEGHNLLHAASLAGHLDVLKYLLPEVPYKVDTTNKHGHTILFTAILAGHLEILKYLEIEVGAKFDVNASDERGMTPLLSALTLPVFQYLLTLSADLGAVCRVGGSCLHYAAARGSLEVVQYLCSEAGTDVLTKDKKGIRPSVWASHSFVHQAKLLLRWNSPLSRKQWEDRRDSPIRTLEYLEEWERRLNAGLPLNTLSSDCWTGR